MRSQEGCWTCRLRRKKCDEVRPTCGTCAALQLECHFSDTKPVWMDGGPLQRNELERIKQSIRQKGHRRWALPVRCASPTVRDSGFSETSHGVVKCSDFLLISFYMDHVFPFSFPFYKPPILQGGKAWLLKLLLVSPVVRQATLCQSSYFLFIKQGEPNNETTWDAVVSRAKNAFNMLQQALSDQYTSGNLHEAVRILVAIILLQRQELALTNFDACRVHLSAAVALFQQIIRDADSWTSTFHQLGPSTTVGQNMDVLSVEQAALRFSASVLLSDDVIASTIHGCAPQLQIYHSALLNNPESGLDIKHVLGYKNEILLQIGRIASLAAQKRISSKANLFQQAEKIQHALSVTLLQLKAEPPMQGSANMQDIFEDNQLDIGHSILVARVWTHAAHAYLSYTIPEWESTNSSTTMQYHVGEILALLNTCTCPPKLLRTMVWPFCLAGCVATPEQQPEFRIRLESLPSNTFATLHAGLAVLEEVWGRPMQERTDFAKCFKNTSVLLV